MLNLLKRNKMKAYIRPNLEVINVKTESLLQNVSGAEGITNGGKFAGGDGDSRRGGWLDDEE